MPMEITTTPDPPRARARAGALLDGHAIAPRQEVGLLDAADGLVALVDEHDGAVVVDVDLEAPAALGLGGLLHAEVELLRLGAEQAGGEVAGGEAAGGLRPG